MTQMGALTAHREHFGDRERRVIAQDILYEAVSAGRGDRLALPAISSVQFGRNTAPLRTSWLDARR